MLHLMSYRFGEGCFGSASPMALTVGAHDEGDGSVMSFVTDMNTHTSECVVLDARNIAAGPVARIMLPLQISSETHACWADASEIRSDRAGLNPQYRESS
jgi:carotenoid cleavage dioxygenase-like enzyme